MTRVLCTLFLPANLITQLFSVSFHKLIVMKYALIPLFFLCGAMPVVHAYDEGVARQAWTVVAQVEKMNNIPRGLLHSMSLVETGQGLEGFILPWPYSIGVNSPTTHTYTSVEEARKDFNFWKSLGFQKFDVTINGKSYGRVVARRAELLIESVKPKETLKLRAHNFSKRFSSHADAAAFGEDLVRKGYVNIDVGLMQLNWRYHGMNFNSVYDALTPRQNAAYAVEYLRSHDGDTWWDKVGRYHSGRQVHAQKYIDLVWKMYKKVHRIS